MQTRQRPEAIRAHRREDVDRAATHLVALLGRHPRHQDVEVAIGVAALIGAAFVIMFRSATVGRRARGGAAADGIKARSVGQGHSVPGGGFDGIFQLLVRRSGALIPTGQLELGEEHIAEGVPAQSVYFDGLLIELRNRNKSLGRPGTEPAAPGVGSHGSPAGRGQEQGGEKDDQRDNRDADQKRPRHRGYTAASAAVTVFCTGARHTPTPPR